MQSHVHIACTYAYICVCGFLHWNLSLQTFQVKKDLLKRTRQLGPVIAPCLMVYYKFNESDKGCTVVRYVMRKLIFIKIILFFTSVVAMLMVLVKKMRTQNLHHLLQP